MNLFFWVPPKDFANIYGSLCNPDQHMEQIEKADVFKRDELFNTRKIKENKNRVKLIFPFN